MQKSIKNLPRLVTAMIIVAVAANGCQLAGLFWHVDETLPDVKGVWQGRIVTVRLYDGKGRPYPTQAAGLELSGGPPIDSHLKTSLHSPGIPPRIVVLTNNGRHALPENSFAVGTWVEVSGTVKTNDLQAPDSNTWIDLIPEPKDLDHESIDALALQFLQIEGPVHPIPAPIVTPVAFGAASAPVPTAEVIPDQAFEWGKEVDGFRLGIKVAHPKVRGNQPVIVSVRLENVGKLPRNLMNYGPLESFQCIATHGGTKSRLTDYGKIFNVEPEIITELQKTTLEPGQKSSVENL